MRLLRFRHEDAESLGALDGDERVIPVPGGKQGGFDSIEEIAALGRAGLERVRELVAGRTGSVGLEDASLLAPVTRPRKILAIGLNYADHIEESGREPPEFQIWFNKQVTALNSPFGDIERPLVSEYLDYEGELCVVIGRAGRHISRDAAAGHIFGFCVGNDVSVRDWQLRTPTMTIGKSFDTHAPVGPWVTTSDEIADPHDLELRTFVNGELRQSSSTGKMVFDVYAQIEHLSTAFTLEPGDILFTGTPAGVGGAMKPPSFLGDGDVVRVEIDGLGAIENRVVEATG